MAVVSDKLGKSHIHVTRLSPGCTASALLLIGTAPEA